MSPKEFMKKKIGLYSERKNIKAVISNSNLTGNFPSIDFFWQIFKKMLKLTGAGKKKKILH